MKICHRYDETYCQPIVKVSLLYDTITIEYIFTKYQSWKYVILRRTCAMTKLTVKRIFKIISNAPSKYHCYDNTALILCWFTALICCCHDFLGKPCWFSIHYALSSHPTPAHRANAIFFVNHVDFHYSTRWPAHAARAHRADAISFINHIDSHYTTRWDTHARFPLHTGTT